MTDRRATADGPVRAARPVGLSARLRAETREAHRDAERAMDLPRRLATLGAYGDLLLTLHEVLLAAAPALDALAPRLPPALGDGPRRRRARLAADLARLGRFPHLAPARPMRPPSPVADLDRALGLWYVHEGAALGGLLIAAEVRRRLPAAAPATGYLAGEGRGTAARWRAVQGVLGDWAPRDGTAADRVLSGARAEFTAIGEALRR